mgnify:CR=1 FL=1
MPYLIIIIGAVILYFALSNYLKNQPEKFNELFGKILAIVLGVAGFLILIKGNIAVGGVLATAAVLSWQGSLWTYLRSKADEQVAAPKQSENSMTRQQALEILELSGNPSEEEIKAAHHRLMKKIHPDQGGSGYFAAQLNQAKDFLLKK